MWTRPTLPQRFLEIENGFAAGEYSRPRLTVRPGEVEELEVSHGNPLRRAWNI
jgi:hypothetical protein